MRLRCDALALHVCLRPGVSFFYRREVNFYKWSRASAAMYLGVRVTTFYRDELIHASPAAACADYSQFSLESLRKIKKEEGGGEEGDRVPVARWTSRAASCACSSWIRRTRY